MTFFETVAVSHKKLGRWNATVSVSHAILTFNIGHWASVQFSFFFTLVCSAPRNEEGCDQLLWNCCVVVVVLPAASLGPDSGLYAR